jgi:hypothetical protein
MGFDAKAIFAGLAEKERIKGHHSPEGRAIRTLSRALNGFSSGDLSRRDVIVLCDQAIEDWLKAKLKISPWATPSMPALFVTAVEAGWMTPVEAAQMDKLRHVRNTIDDERVDVPAQEMELALRFCIELIEKHW